MCTISAGYVKGCPVKVTAERILRRSDVVSELPPFVNPCNFCNVIRWRGELTAASINIDQKQLPKTIPFTEPQKLLTPLKKSNT